MSNIPISSLPLAISLDGSETVPIVQGGTTKRATLGQISILIGGGREALTANRTYFVRADGSNSNTGRVDTAAGAFLTIQKAIDTVAFTLDLHGFNVVIQVDNGAYTDPVLVSGPWLGAGSVTLQAATPSGAVLSTGNHNAIQVQNDAVLAINGIKTITSGTFAQIAVIDGGDVSASNVEFAGTSGQHITAAFGGRMHLTGNYTISGGGQSHWHSHDGGFIEVLTGTMISLIGTPAFSSYYAGAAYGGNIQVAAGVSIVGAATGSQFLTHNLGTINTNGLTLPGSVAGGTQDSWGLYNRIFSGVDGLSGGAFVTADTYFSGNANTVRPSPLTFPAQFNAVGANDGIAGYASDAYGAGVNLDFSRLAFGTAAAPTAVNAQAVIKTFAAQAYNSALAYGNVAALDLIANNAQTGTDNGGRMVGRVTPPGSIGLVEVWRASKGFMIGTTSDQGAGTLNLLNGLYNNGAAPTGTGGYVRATSPALVTPDLGTPSALVGTNITGTASGLTAGHVTTNANLTGDVTSVGNATTLATVNSNVGTFGSATQVAQVTVNGKGLVTAVSSATIAPAIGSITGLGTGVATALGINIGSAGAPVLLNGAGGTPSSLTLTNATGLPTTGLTGTLQAAQEPAHTGDVTNSAGSLALTLSAGNAGNLNSGTLLAARMPALTGEATTSAGAVAVTLTNSAVIGKLLTGYTSGAGTVSAADSILQAIQKLNGNDATNANLTGDITSVGNATMFTGKTGGALGQIPGTATNDNASAGNVGEYIESSVASPGVSLSTNAAANVTSISLTAGDWNVVLNASFLTGATTNITQTIISLSSTSATLDISPGKFAALNFTPTVFGAVNQSVVLQSFRISLAATTTIYFVARSTFTISTMSVWGLISARRGR